jgi:hypothetical protein
VTQLETRKIKNSTIMPRGKGEKQILIDPRARGRYWEPVSVNQKMAGIGASCHPVKKNKVVSV